MPEACVLITVYNGAPWLEEALDCALAQQGIEAEILVVDDGSTDATPEILRRRVAAAPGRIRVLRTEHGGLSSARNTGADHTEAEFITTLDADDRMHPLRVKLECDALRAHPDAVVSVSGRWNFLDGAGSGTWAFTPGAFRTKPGQLFTRLADPLSAMLAAGEYPGTSACTCRTRWARGPGRFDPTYAAFVDGERWIRCLYDTPAVYVAAPLYQRRVHGAAMSAARTTVERSVFAAIDAARSDWSRYNPEQRTRLLRFEKNVALSSARRIATTEGRGQAIAFLLRHAPRLHSPEWWRTLAFLLTPPAVHAAWRRRSRGGRPADRPLVPLSEVTAPDPTLVWVPEAVPPPE